jgi:Icc-related predicted phosphoesterase
MKICFASDNHGQFFHIPECDVLVISGDICPNFVNHPRTDAEYQRNWLHKEFAQWISKTKQVICTYGNHDYVGEYLHKEVNIPNCKFLVDESFVYNGLKFYGSPWQRRFYDWAFNLDEEDLNNVYDLIPNDVDVLITHGPPYSYGDSVPSFNGSLPELAGSKKLTSMIRQNKPKVCVYGHIHHSHGQYELGSSLLLNASVVNEKYTMTNGLFLVTISNNTVWSCDKVLAERVYYA